MLNANHLTYGCRIIPRVGPTFRGLYLIGEQEILIFGYISRIRAASALVLHLFDDWSHFYLFRVFFIYKMTRKRYLGS